MSESSMRSHLIKKMRALDAIAIESPSTALGIPDINFIGGWFECKWLKEWPKGADINPVKFKHPLTKEQQLWNWRRERQGGLSMIVAKVSRSWFFWSGLRMKEKKLWHNMTRPQMIAEAELYMPNGLEMEKLMTYLKQRSS